MATIKLKNSLPAGVLDAGANTDPTVVGYHRGSDGVMRQSDPANYHSRDDLAGRRYGFVSHNTYTAKDGTTVKKYNSFGDKIARSAAYQQAYKIFSADSQYGTPYLNRLELIPAMAQEANYTLWDDLELSNSANDKNYAAYQLAMEQISALVTEYYAFINSLPVNQVSQMLDAGIYGAVSGQGIDGSEIDPIATKTDPSAISSTNPMEMITSLGSLALSFCSGPVTAIAGAWSAIQNVRQNQANYALNREAFNLDKDRYNLDNQKFLSDLWTRLDSSGYNMSSTSFETFDDFVSWAETYSAADPHAMVKRSNDATNATIAGIYDKSLEPFRNRDASGLRNFGGDFEKFYLDLGNYQIDQAFHAIRWRAAENKFNADYNSKINGNYKGDADNALWRKTAFESYFTRKLEEEKLKFFEDQLSKIKKSNDPVAKFAVTQLMFNDPLLSKVALATEVSTPLLNAAQQAAQRVNDPSNPAFYLEDM